MISFLDMFKVGNGPSSSHTVGPMKICLAFLETLEQEGHWAKLDGIEVEVYGSLALTGIGHGTDKAILLGLMGEKPHTVDPETIPAKVESVKTQGKILLQGKKEIRFSPKEQVKFLRTKTLLHHS